ncbi:helix-turn-helix transcriptional regulator [Streptomyces sp. NBC_00053]|uniref:winged helix-turn-helix transcriptional regulator n=1 Tax=unclassified Streptomyces TaxID=2593676 RepID=UPI000F5BAAD7|nr:MULTISPECIES: helix-turn-helix domain-containing protein [unclassified Streptomyces]WSG51672.1 helix-turn-helix transcriptional regulator [Streptomyces sp. NBC_01732]WSX02329.1 helix-turn-helix transcriptional regulator [Streptomyces sp. NBC_00987]MCX4395748.1 helix-turn-helix transcriptional regulator [Streptomyces sp. NBC_01767]MCX5101620.1 helix-turn-helix transcriptional regulator [Streptomyces sp. NBC_00439]MCX5161144.1 helix-turn-helix transcriptional regulator [Streptomyces sp. NBC_0
MSAAQEPHAPTAPTVTLPGRPCSAAAALHVVGEKWALLAVREIFFGNHRFEAIARNTGAPRDRLAARLRSLEQAGVVERRPYNERPPRYEYHLTESGRDLAPVIRALLEWGDRWVLEDRPVVMVHEPAADARTPWDAGMPGGTQSPAHAHDLDAAWICRTCGEEVVMNTLTVDVRAPGWDRSGPSEPSPSDV